MKTFLFLLFLFSKIYAQESWNRLWEKDYDGPTWLTPCTISQDGNYIASSSSNLKVWSTNNSKLLWAGYFPKGDNPIQTNIPTSIDISSDNSFIVSSSSEGIITLRDLKIGDLFWTYDFGASIWSIKFSPDNKVICCGSSDGTLFLLDTKHGGIIWSLKFNNSVYKVAFSEDGKYVATISFDNYVRLIDINNGEIKWERSVKNKPRDLFICNDGTSIITCGGEVYNGTSGDLILWNILDGTVIWSKELSVPFVSVSSSSDNFYLVSGDDSSNVKMWDKKTGQLLWSKTLYERSVNSLCFSNDNSKILSAGYGHIMLNDVKTGELLWQDISQQLEIWMVKYNSDNSKFISINRNGKLIVWSNKPIIELIEPMGGETRITDSEIEFSWVSSGVDRINIEYSTNDGSDWMNFANNINASDKNIRKQLEGLSPAKYLFKLTSTDNPSVFCISKEVDIIADRAKENWNLIWSTSNKVSMFFADFNNDETLILTRKGIGYEGAPYVIDVLDYQNNVQVYSEINALGKFNPINPYQIYSWSNNSIKITNIIKNSDNSYTNITLWSDTLNYPIQTVVYSNDNSKIAVGTGYWDSQLKKYFGEITLLNSSNGKILWIGKHDYQVERIVFSPNDNIIVSCGDPATGFYHSGDLKVWAVDDGVMLWSKNPVYGGSINFTPDGNNIVFANVSNSGDNFKSDFYSANSLTGDIEFTFQLNKSILLDVNDETVVISGLYRDSFGTMRGDLGLWNIKSKTMKWFKEKEFYGSASFVSNYKYIFAWDAQSGSFKLIDAETGLLKWERIGYPPYYTFLSSYDQSKVVCTDYHWGGINLFSISTGEELWSNYDHSEINYATFNKDDSKLLITTSTGAEIWQLNSTSTSSKNEVIPNYTYLYQNYPNPFNPSTTISFRIDKASTISLKLYNVLGQELKTISSGYFNAGKHTIQFSANNLSSGVYFYRLTADSFSTTKKLMIIK